MNYWKYVFTDVLGRCLTLRPRVVAVEFEDGIVFCLESQCDGQILDVVEVVW